MAVGTRSIQPSTRWRRLLVIMYNNRVPEARAIREVMLLRSRISCYRLAVATSAVHAALFDRSSGAAAYAGRRSDGYAHRGPATNDSEPSTFSKVAGSLHGRELGVFDPPKCDEKWTQKFSFLAIIGRLFTLMN